MKRASRSTSCPCRRNSTRRSSSFDTKEPVNLLEHQSNNSTMIKASSSKSRFHARIKLMARRNEAFGPSSRPGAVYPTTTSWTSVFGLKQRQSTSRTTYLHRRLWTNKTPFETIYKAKPSVKHMQVFGCRAYVLNTNDKRVKWDPKAREGLFMGYQ